MKNRVGLVYDERMLLHEGEEGHPECPDRLRLSYAKLKEDGLLDQVDQLPSRLATDAELQRVHTADHVTEIKRLAKSASQLAYFGGTDTYLNTNTEQAARLSAGSPLNLIDAIMDPKSPVGAGFALVRPPGHHAAVAKSSGFCIFNNAAVAARHAMRRPEVSKVAILDWDVHHGDGTAAIFAEDPNVLFISMHRHGAFYPGTGFKDEIGKSAGAGYTLNIPLVKGYGDPDVVFVMTSVVVPAIDKFRPDFLIVSAGFDAMRGDPLGECNVSPSGFAWMTHVVYELAQEYCQGRLCLLCEGGYSLTMLPRVVAATVAELIRSTSLPPVEDPAPPASPSHSYHLDRVLGCLLPVEAFRGVSRSPKASPGMSPMSSPASSVASSPKMGASSTGGTARPKTLSSCRQVTELHHRLALHLPLCSKAGKLPKQTRTMQRWYHDSADERSDFGHSDLSPFSTPAASPTITSPKLSAAMGDLSFTLEEDPAVSDKLMAALARLPDQEALADTFSAPGLDDDFDALTKPFASLQVSVPEENPQPPAPAAAEAAAPRKGRKKSKNAPVSSPSPSDDPGTEGDQEPEPSPRAEEGDVSKPRKKTNRGGRKNKKKNAAAAGAGGEQPENGAQPGASEGKTNGAATENPAGAKPAQSSAPEKAQEANRPGPSSTPGPAPTPASPASEFRPPARPAPASGSQHSAADDSAKPQSLGPAAARSQAQRAWGPPQTIEVTPQEREFYDLLAKEDGGGLFAAVAHLMPKVAATAGDGEDSVVLQFPASTRGARLRVGVLPPEGLATPGDIGFAIVGPREAPRRTDGILARSVLLDFLSKAGEEAVRTVRQTVSDFADWAEGAANVCVDGVVIDMVVGGSSEGAAATVELTRPKLGPPNTLMVRGLRALLAAMPSLPPAPPAHSAANTGQEEVMQMDLDVDLEEVD
mmetsp:Transcript_67710/g.180265  ORF Transcript_67710/g.180265 Transcript_67710/m.180265 type:complete len:927 (+) Transcript_67710:39-2819(+)